MKSHRPRNRLRGSRRIPRVVVVAGWLSLLIAALSLVTWRQTRGVQMETALRQLETQRAIAEAERIEAERRVEELRGRTRITRVARERLGMHLPADSEIVYLPVGMGNGELGIGNREQGTGNSLPEREPVLAGRSGGGQ